jgi:hypothetical protein
MAMPHLLTFSRRLTSEVYSDWLKNQSDNLKETSQELLALYTLRQPPDGKLKWFPTSSISSVLQRKTADVAKVLLICITCPDILSSP